MNRTFLTFIIIVLPKGLFILPIWLELPKPAVTYYSCRWNFCLFQTFCILVYDTVQKGRARASASSCHALDTLRSMPKTKFFSFNKEN